jgi:hypothetical protein
VEGRGLLDAALLQPLQQIRLPQRASSPRRGGRLSDGFKGRRGLRHVRLSLSSLVTVLVILGDITC